MAKKRLKKISKSDADKLQSYFKRCGADTPPFFMKLRNIGLIIAAAGTAIIATPISLPAVVSTIAGYLILGGSVATAISQAAIPEDCKLSNEDERSSKGLEN